MRKTLLSFFSLAACFAFNPKSQAQSYRIDLELPAFRDSQLIVAGYYFGGLYVKDTLQLDTSGKAVFSGDQALPQGLYQLYLNPQKQFDFLVGTDQHFSLTVPAGAVRADVKSAPESEKFQQYINFLARQKATFAVLNAREQSLKNQPDSLKTVQNAIRELDNEVKKYQSDEGRKNPDNLFGKIMLANRQPELAESDIPAAWQSNDSLRWVYGYNYRKNHYWDNFDLNNMGLWHTPFVKDRLNEYFNRVLLQVPDSVLPEAIRIIDSHRNNPEVFQNLCSYLVNNAIQSKMMGIENVFVALAERYYLSGLATWADEKTMENIRREVALRKHNLIGNQAPELLLEDETGEFKSLKQCPTDYTLLVFWEPGCGHCKKEIPKLYDEVFLAATPSKLSVYAVYTMTDKNEWTDFITEHGLSGWLNVWDPNQVSDMRLLYGIRTTPSLFLIDREKKIVAKQLDAAGMKQLLKVYGVLK